MKAQELRDHFRGKAPWVDWDGQTVDQFLHGDPSVEVRGIAVGWILTAGMARQAAAGGADVFVTHEPIFYDGYWRLGGTRRRLGRAQAEKRRLLDRLGLTVLRCHDTWDRFPKVGIPDAWAAWLGLGTYRRAKGRFYGRIALAPTTARALGRRVLRRVRPLGQQHVEVFGGRTRVASLCVGTGAITSLADMIEQVRADCYLVTNDGSNAWTTEHHATDRGIPLLRVDHATAELPGMMALAAYLGRAFPQVRTTYVPYACPYELLGGS